jgi:HD-like signal output (HDOD) protein
LLDDPIGDAFSGGLLHDVGEALLYRCAPGLWQITQDSKNPLDAQVRTFGMNHQRAGHLVLQAWQLPDRLLDAVGRHHEGFDSAPPVARSVACAEAVVENDFVTAASYGLSFDDIEQMQVDIQDEAAALHAWLQNR